MKRLLAYVRIKDNREMISWICGGILAVGSLAFAALNYFDTPATSATSDGTTALPCASVAAIVTDTDGFILANSGTTSVALADVAALSPCQRWVARNEIFARNGRFFVTPILKEHFGAQPWYTPTHPFTPLTDLAQTNVDLIRSLEN